MGSKEKQSSKYIIEARFVVDGVVERHDVIGAIFGQTEGLFPKDFELRELQKSGKIGRIDITLKSEKDRTEGKIVAPSSLDRAQTAIIAAAMETVDRIGPCESKITIEKISDVRFDKREQILQRAKALMRDWVVTETQDIEKLLNEVSREDKTVKPVTYGREKLTATPGVSRAKKILLVEGRADVINLLKAGYTDVIALEGVKIPKTIINLVMRKETTAFLDGDRGGDLILKELMQVAKPKFVARAPRGKEVEELTPEEIEVSLARKVKFEELTPEKIEVSLARKVKLEEVEDLSSLAEIARGLRGTLEGVLVKKDGSQIKQVPVSELVEKLKAEKDVEVVVFDGIVTGRLVDTATERGIKTLVGERVADGVKVPKGLQIKVFKDL
ncbi:MAG TPA: DNA primase DnaG [Patescibacteria group bacterium]|nr:DNA primase DnaG [Patescibacteria group bacterium]